MTCLLWSGGCNEASIAAELLCCRRVRQAASLAVGYACDSATTTGRSSVRVPFALKTFLHRCEKRHALDHHC